MTEQERDAAIELEIAGCIENDIPIPLYHSWYAIESCLKQGLFDRDTETKQMMIHAVAAMKKQIPEKINGTDCPICSLPLHKDEEYCARCGQKIDWEVEDENNG